MSAFRDLPTPTFDGVGVRIVENDPVTVVLKDVADALGYTASNLKRSIKEKYRVPHKVKDAAGRRQEMICVTRPGLTQALATLTPRDDEKRVVVDDFQDWLYEEVMESIYDTGSYSVGGDKLEDDPIIKMRRDQLQAQREREEMKREISTLREERNKALKQLDQARSPDAEVPEKGVRSEINELVRAHAYANGDFGPAWRRLYKEYRQRAGIDLDRRASNRGDATKLDIADELGVLEELYRVAYDLYA
jgi:prophage antirepressor-like protein